eukprot:CAMPEP_0116926780 /NCGR_PEP_ID=MMETSP0467-20121206/24933_1 /TAXON_ID=283647 /ORGANISM="Mesodinium pulex, Strain SPMC105" /LENGTH=138 /DNA_ID=CAMNT_0004606111 /DNA_START=511 /DNA_END=927 /DNA_ORIENTATION=-
METLQKSKHGDQDLIDELQNQIEQKNDAIEDLYDRIGKLTEELDARNREQPNAFDIQVVQSDEPMVNKKGSIELSEATPDMLNTLNPNKLKKKKGDEMSQRSFQGKLQDVDNAIKKFETERDKVKPLKLHFRKVAEDT